MSWRSVQPWKLVAPLALTGAAGGALWINLTEGVLPGVGSDSGFTQLLYAWWVPGLLFGIAFSATLRFEPREALAFSTLTGAIYFAGVALSLFLNDFGAFDPPFPFAWEGAVAGGLGAWLFHRVAVLFLDVRPVTTASAVLAVGVLVGGVLVHVLEPPGASKLGIVLVCAGWGAGVGFSSYRLIAASGTADYPNGSLSKRLRDALSAPIVQTLGLCVTLASVISLLMVLV